MAEVLREVPAAKHAGQRRLLALDGGGIRGVLSLQVLGRIEQTLGEEADNDDFRLSDYFDYFAGTSTGALIAAGLAQGWRVDRIAKLYTETGEEIFKAVPMYRKMLSLFQAKYESKSLKKALQREFGEDTLFGDAKFKSLLLAVMHNSVTDSPWPLSNNPNAKYNDPSREDCNNRFPLWQVLRASSAAPTYFPPERIDIPGQKPFLFVDGGITPSNNPSLQLFLQATSPDYRLGWSGDPDSMLLVSIGTGSSPNDFPDLTKRQMNIIHTAKSLPATFMNGSAVQQDIVCRMLGHCLTGPPIDRELGQVLGTDETRSAKHFTYLRYNAELTTKGMTDLGLTKLTDGDSVKKIRSLDAIDPESLSALISVGQAVADKWFDKEHYSGFPA